MFCCREQSAADFGETRLCSDQVAHGMAGRQTRRQAAVALSYGLAGLPGQTTDSWAGGVATV